MTAPLGFCGEWNIGRFYQIRGGPEHLRWFWALHFPSKPENLRTDNRVATLEAAKAEFEASWEAWKAWAKMLGGRPMQQMGDARKECFAVRDPSYQQATEPLAPVRGVLFVGYPALTQGRAADAV